MRFVVVADSHIRYPDDDVDTYPSNALMLDRNRRVVELVDFVAADFVVHLGDIVHPLPVEDGHEPAVELAAGVYADLTVPIHFVPGNHDIGDKPDAMVAVPAVAEENYGVFERHWGSPYFSFDVGDCHFVIVDTPVLNSGLRREREQAEWLEGDLRRAAGKRIFVFTHYPPFVKDQDEDEHYDNLGEPARSWLLDQIRAFKVEAVFSGHVHNFLYNHHAGTELYVLPATGFVRPDYSELAAIGPEREWGRDDPAKLGFFIVDVGPTGHTVTPVRSDGSVAVGATIPPSVADAAERGWRSPVGVTLRHGWMTETEFPTAGLDEFRRKTVRNDSALLALWAARIDHLRIPIGDLATPSRVARLGHLYGRGMRFTVRSAGVPDRRTATRVTESATHLESWELVLWPDQYESALEAIGDVPVPVVVGPVVPIGEGAVHHFVTAGFDPGDEESVARLAGADPNRCVSGLLFRTESDGDLTEVLEEARKNAGRFGRTAQVVVEMPRAGESTPFQDDEAIADFVERVTRAADDSTVPVFLDGLMDHDRGYYPRHGLIDRRSNPRLALDRLIAVAAEKRGRSDA